MTVDRSGQPTRGIRGRIAWPIIVIGVVGLAIAAVLAVPVILPGQTGSSGQGAIDDGYPTTVSAIGDDGLQRTITVTTEDGGEPDLGSVRPGDRVVVTGTGFDANRGIYVAICQIPDGTDVRPGPCLGGVPEVTGEGGGEGAVEWAPSNWINDEWAWRLFGARSFDSASGGTFTAYLLVPASAEDGLDCVAVECGIFTRNDHTALDNRMQDIYLPLGFSQ